MPWGKPTIGAVLDNTTAYGGQANVSSLDTPDAWMLLIIETQAAVAHPIHLHGHDFYVLASGTGELLRGFYGLHSDGLKEHLHRPMRHFKRRIRSGVTSLCSLGLDI